jgi:hypothetical protein
MKTLAERLDETNDHYRSLARGNYYFAYGLVAATILASAIAGITAITESLPPLVIGILAFIPAFASLAASYLKPQARANWHYRKAARLAALYRRLVDQQVDPAKIAEDWTTIDDEFDAIWEANFGLDASAIRGASKLPQSN